METTTTLVLLKHGDYDSVQVPDKLSELLNGSWSHPQLFPHGVESAGACHLTMQAGTAFMTTLFASRDQDTMSYADANLHELPHALDNQMFFGHLLLVVSRNGVVIEFDDAQYDSLMGAENNAKSRDSFGSHVPAATDNVHDDMDTSTSESESETQEEQSDDDDASGGEWDYDDSSGSGEPSISIIQVIATDDDMSGSEDAFSDDDDEDAY